MTDIPDDFLKGNTELTGTLKLGGAGVILKTIGSWAFANTKLTSLYFSSWHDLHTRATIKDFAFANTDITGTLVIGSYVKAIGEYAFGGTEITGLDLWNSPSLLTIGKRAFADTNLRGKISTPFDPIPTYTTGGSAASFPPGVTIVGG